MSCYLLTEDDVCHSFFDGLETDDGFSEKQIGFKATNVFIMQLTS